MILLRSLTKVAAPGLRVAALGARGAAGARLRAMRHVDDFFVSGPLQLAALELVASTAWRKHLRALRAILRERRDALAGAVAQELPQLTLGPLPRGGLHLWARLPAGSDDVRLAADAAAAGVIVSPGTPAFATDPPAPYLRLTFAGAAPPELAEGVRRLAGVLSAARHDRLIEGAAHRIEPFWDAQAAIGAVIVLDALLPDIFGVGAWRFAAAAVGAALLVALMVITPWNSSSAAAFPGRRKLAFAVNGWSSRSTSRPSSR